MRIKIVNDGRVIEGTALQIVQQMQSVAFGKDDRAVADYVDWVAAEVARLMEVSLDVKGETGDERARSLVDEMLRTGLAEKL
jgi:hypothetical protein